MVSLSYPPPWIVQGNFQRAADPTGANKPTVWRAAGAPFSASFGVPYHDGDKLIELWFDAYGTGSAEAGLLNILTTYHPRSGGDIRLSASVDVGREARWGKAYLVGLAGPVDLVAGQLTVTFDVTEQDYYIGNVTATFQRTCAP